MCFLFFKPFVVCMFWCFRFRDADLPGPGYYEIPPSFQTKDEYQAYQIQTGAKSTPFSTTSKRFIENTEHLYLPGPGTYIDTEKVNLNILCEKNA